MRKSLVFLIAGLILSPLLMVIISTVSAGAAYGFFLVVYLGCITWAIKEVIDIWRETRSVARCIIACVLIMLSIKAGRHLPRELIRQDTVVTVSNVVDEIDHADPCILADTLRVNGGLLLSCPSSESVESPGKESVLVWNYTDYTGRSVADSARVRSSVTTTYTFVPTFD
jgi:hypothetical protein